MSGGLIGRPFDSVCVQVREESRRQGAALDEISGAGGAPAGAGGGVTGRQEGRGPGRRPPQGAAPGADRPRAAPLRRRRRREPAAAGNRHKCRVH